MRVHHAVHVRHVAVDVRVRRRIRRRRLRPIHHVSVQIAHHHARRRQVLVAQTRRLDHHQIRRMQTLRHITRRPHHQVPLDQLLMQGRHDLTHLLDLSTNLRTKISQRNHNHHSLFLFALIYRDVHQRRCRRAGTHERAQYSPMPAIGSCSMPTTSNSPSNIFLARVTSATGSGDSSVHISTV